jgi:hypothetical protein
VVLFQLIGSLKAQTGTSILKDCLNYSSFDQPKQCDGLPRSLGRMTCDFFYDDFIGSFKHFVFPIPNVGKSSIDFLDVDMPQIFVPKI